MPNLSAMKKVVAIIGMLFSLSAQGNEDFCLLENGHVAIEKRSWLRNYSFELMFPKTSGGILYRIQLRYDNIEKYGGHELLADLGFKEYEEGYASSITIAHDHKPIWLIAAYHIGNGKCFSNIHIKIENGNVGMVKNAS